MCGLLFYRATGMPHAKCQLRLSCLAPNCFSTFNRDAVAVPEPLLVVWCNSVSDSTPVLAENLRLEATMRKQEITGALA
jgi:hypothetical protein